MTAMPQEDMRATAFPLDPRIAVIGLGYVGLPLAVALARSFEVTGFDIDAGRVAELGTGHDRTREVDVARLTASTLALSCDPAVLAEADCIIVTVPTPVDDANVPDLSPVLAATRGLAAQLRAGRRTVIVYESTVYPGVTEDICGPEIERVSGLRRGIDFFLGYSPERINPGDKVHTVDRITKIVAGENDAVTDFLDRVYSAVTSAGTFRAASIKTAEAAKVIENAQRDINIAFMNEITQIFGRMGLSVFDVLEAAGTKWNFLNFVPGLVGGHCIGVDPYYLSHCAQQLGHDPNLILAGRSMNDGMGGWVAERVSERIAPGASVLVLGLTFKENVPDLRNSKVVDLVARLQALGHAVTLHDPIADPAEAAHELGLEIDARALDRSYDAVLAAVPHDAYRAMDADRLAWLVREGGLLADMKGLWRGQALGEGVRYWTL